MLPLRRTLVVAAIAALLPVASPPPARAQAVKGSVIDRDHDRPIAGVRVTLLEPGLTPHDSTLTDHDGSFALAAPGPGDFVLIARLPGYMTISQPLRLEAGEVTDLQMEIPLISVAAAVAMHDAITRESTFQLPLEEICREPLRPWEAGVLVGVTRSRSTREPLPAVLVTLDPLDPRDSRDAPLTDGDDRPVHQPRNRLSTDSGAYWFCNVPAGRVRLIARAAGVPPDTSHATIRAGTISWYDIPLRSSP